MEKSNKHQMKESIKKELASISPLLSSLKEQQKNPSVPKNYFAEMQEDILARLDDQQNNGNKKQSIFSFKLRFVTAIAASLAIIMGIGLYFFNTPTVTNSTELTENQIRNYIDSRIDEYDIDMIEDFVLEENLETSILDDLDNEGVIEYLEEQLDDMDDTFFEELY